MMELFRKKKQSGLAELMSVENGNHLWLTRESMVATGDVVSDEGSGASLQMVATEDVVSDEGSGVPSQMVASGDVVSDEGPGNALAPKYPLFEASNLSGRRTKERSPQQLWGPTLVSGSNRMLRRALKRQVLGTVQQNWLLRSGIILCLTTRDLSLDMAESALKKASSLALFGTHH